MIRVCLGLGIVLGAVASAAAQAPVTTAPVTTAPVTTAPAPAGPGSGAVVTVARATNSCFSALVRATGYLTPRTEAMVMFGVEGYRIAEISAAEGDRVTQGQQLVSLTRVGAPPAGPAPAAATVVLRAPAAGLITRSTARIGATTSARAEPLFSIAVGGEIEVASDIPSIHVPKLSPGQSARVQLDDGRELGGFVRLVPAEINRSTQLGQARLSIENEPGLKVGMFARVSIDANRSCGLSVPRAAIFNRSEGASIQVVKNVTVETRRVKLGLLSDNNAEVLDGVADGELVVANAGTSLRDGDRVRPIFADAPGAR